MFYFLGLSLLFALLLAVNILISSTASVLWRVFDARTQNWSARSRTQLIFSLRIFPLLFALIFTFAFLIPSYFLFEPHLPDETVSLKLAIPALISLIGISVAIFRVFGTWWRTHRLIKSWLRCSELIQIENLSLPIYRIKHQFPVIAVVGVFKPKLFIAEQVFESLDENELSAAIRHECGHLATHDNLKRMLLRICRDLLVFPLGKKLERAWAENSESAADEFAAQTNKTTAINLAAALIKIVKIVPPNTTPTMPVAGYLIESQNLDVTWRIRRLLKMSENTASNTQTSTNSNLIYTAIFGFIAILTLFSATNYNVLQAVHGLLEKVVGVLQ
jgi:Zn-dependent protease with chaperone function